MSQGPRCEVLLDDGLPCGRAVHQGTHRRALRVALPDGRAVFACEACVPQWCRGDVIEIDWRDDYTDTVKKVSAVRGRLPSRLATRYPPIGRNDPCPCGSGRKFKKCHALKTRAHSAPPPTRRARRGYT